MPAGWKVYSGTKSPFVIAYPPDWVVDEAELGKVYFRAPGAVPFALIYTGGGPDPNANVDVLRDQLFKNLTLPCGKTGIDTTRNETYSGITFATLGSTCDQADGLQYVYTGLGLRNQVPWAFAFFSRYADYEINNRQYFTPMLATLNIFGAP